MLTRFYDTANHAKYKSTAYPFINSANTLTHSHTNAIFDLGADLNYKIGDSTKSNSPNVCIQGVEGCNTIGSTNPDGSIQIDGGFNLVSGGLACRVAGNLFVWSQKDSPLLGKLNTMQVRKLEKMLIKESGMHRLVVINNCPHLHRSEQRKEQQDIALVLHSSAILDSGTTNNVLRMRPDMKIRDELVVEGVAGRTSLVKRTHNDELIIEQGRELISLGRACIIGGYSFIWLPGRNEPFFGKISEQAKNEMQTILSRAAVDSLAVEQYVPMLSPTQTEQLYKEIGEQGHQIREENKLKEEGKLNSWYLQSVKPPKERVRLYTTEAAPKWVKDFAKKQNINHTHVIHATGTQRLHNGIGTHVRHAYPRERQNLPSSIRPAERITFCIDKDKNTISEVRDTNLTSAKPAEWSKAFDSLTFIKYTDLYETIPYENAPEYFMYVCTLEDSLMIAAGGLSSQVPIQRFDEQTLLQALSRGDRHVFIIKKSDLQRKNISIQKFVGVESEDIFYAQDNIPSDCLLANIECEKLLGSIPMVQVCKQGEHPQELPLYEAVEAATEILVTAYSSTVCPPVTHIAASASKPIELATGDQALKFNHPHRFHFPRRADCPICQRQHLQHRHSARNRNVRLGCWAIDVAHGPDGAACLVFTQASTDSIQTIHSVILENMESTTISFAIMRGLVELEYFYSTDVVRRIQSDKAPAIMKEKNTLLAKHFIHLTTTQGGDSSSNGNAERAIRTIKDITSTSLDASGLPQSAWAQGMVHSGFVYSSSKRTCNRKTPYNDPQWMRKAVQDLQPFGSACVVGKGPKAEGLAGRSAIYFYPSSDVSGHHVGIINDNTKELDFFDDVVTVKPLLNKGNYSFPKIHIKDNVRHIYDEGTHAVQCQRCYKLRSLAKEDVKEAQGDSGFYCEKLADCRCHDPEHPSLAAFPDASKHGPHIGTTPVTKPSGKPGRPKGAKNKPRKANNISDEVGKKRGRKRGSPNRKVAQLLLAGACHLISDQASQTQIDLPPAQIVPNQPSEQTISGELTWESSIRSHVYKELGVDACKMTPGGEEAVAKELNKYLSTRSLGKPIPRSSIPTSAVIYKSKMLFGQKEAETNDPVAKARLVIGGHLGFNKHGRVVVKSKTSTTDYWAPTASLSAVRYAVSYTACRKNFALSCKDLSQAYLQSVSNEASSFVELPLSQLPFTLFPAEVQLQIRELRENNVDDADILFPVVASLYGLPSSGYTYWRNLEAHLIRQGWKKGRGSVFIKGDARLVCYVDDLLLSCDKTQEDATWRDILGSRWQADGHRIEVGKPGRYLGIYIHKTEDGSYRMEQEQYILSVIKAYENMTGRKIKARKTIPTANTNGDTVTFFPHVNLHAKDEPDISCHPKAHVFAARSQAQVSPHHSCIGGLMYICRGTRPDIAREVAQCSERVHSWTADDDAALEGILGYLLGNEKSIEYNPLPEACEVQELQAVAYTDSNFLAPTSRSGLVVTLQHPKVPGRWTHVIDWSSKKQAFTSLSSTQAEVTALVLAARVLVECVDDMSEVFGPMRTPYIFGDSAAALAAVRRGFSNKLSGCNRAVGCAVAWLHECVTHDRFRMSWISGLDNPADSLTKTLSSQKCRLRPVLSSRKTDGSWTKPAARFDTDKPIPQSCQPIFQENVNRCYECGTSAELCFKCKCCRQCGCACHESVEDADSELLKTLVHKGAHVSSNCNISHQIQTPVFHINDVPATSSKMLAQRTICQFSQSIARDLTKEVKSQERAFALTDKVSKDGEERHNYTKYLQREYRTRADRLIAEQPRRKNKSRRRIYNEGREYRWVRNALEQVKNENVDGMKSLAESAEEAGINIPWKKRIRGQHRGDFPPAKCSADMYEAPTEKRNKSKQLTRRSTKEQLKPGKLAQPAKPLNPGLVDFKIQRKKPLRPGLVKKVDPDI